MTAHHKSTEALAHRNALLRWYYSIYPLFGYCCVGTEFYYILLYVHHFFPHPYVYQVNIHATYYVLIEDSSIPQIDFHHDQHTCVGDGVCVPARLRAQANRERDPDGLCGGGDG